MKPGAAAPGFVYVELSHQVCRALAGCNKWGKIDRHQAELCKLRFPGGQSKGPFLQK